MKPLSKLCSLCHGRTDGALTVELGSQRLPFCSIDHLDMYLARAKSEAMQRLIDTAFPVAEPLPPAA